MTDSQDELGEAREEEARTDALADSHDEVEPAAEEAQQTGYLDAEPPPETDGEEAGEPEGTGYVDAEGQVDGKYRVAHIVDIEEDQTVSLCGEKIEGDLLGNRVLAYTCTPCYDALTAQKNELADALLDLTSRLSVARSALGMVGLDENFSGWTDRVERALGKAARDMLRQVQSGPRNER